MTPQQHKSSESKDLGKLIVGGLQKARMARSNSTFDELIIKKGLEDHKNFGGDDKSTTEESPEEKNTTSLIKNINESETSASPAEKFTEKAQEETKQPLFSDFNEVFTERKKDIELYKRMTQQFEDLRTEKYPTTTNGIHKEYHKSAFYYHKEDDISPPEDNTNAPVLKANL